MTLKDRFDRAKKKAKRHLGLDNSSSTSLPAPTPSRLSPAPQVVRRTGSPSLPNSDNAPLLLLNDTSNPIPAGPMQSLLSPRITPTADTVSTTQPPAPSAIQLQPGITESDDTDKNTEDGQARLWPGLKALLKMAESTRGLFPPLQSAVSGLNECIEIFENASRGRTEYDELRKRLDSLLADLKDHIRSTTSTKITVAMKNLCIGLNKELAVVQGKNTRGAVQRHAEAIDDSNEILACYQRIQGHLERLTLNANLSTWETVNRLEMDARLHRLCPSLSAVYNSAESEDVHRRACTAGTRTKELDRLLTWAHDKSSKMLGDVYWMNGMAGTGKTSIAYSVCTELEGLEVLGASFFCSRLIPECRDVKLIIPSIAYQLADFSNPFRYALSNILEADPNVHTRVLKIQFESLLVKPMMEAKHTLPADFVVVIDALDECENEDSIGLILDLLLSLTVASQVPIRFLISSRPEPDIYRRIMDRIGNIPDARLVLHDLEEERVKKDIETYLAVELREIGLTPSQLDSLVSHSGVLFIYASTVARYIQDGFRLGQHVKRLNMVLGIDPSPALGRDQQIDLLYGSVLQAAFDTKYLEDSDRRTMKTILETAICAQQPLTIAGLAGFLQLHTVMVDRLLRLLASLLNVGEKTQLVTTLHASFSDFMLTPQRSNLFYCDAETIHTRLAQACFHVIRNNEPQLNICALESSYTRDDAAPDLIARVDQAVPPQLFYACLSWIPHLERAGDHSNLDPLLREMLSTELLLWMEVLNLKKCIHLGLGILQRAESCCTKCDYSNETLELARDAWRFVATFTSHPVSQSTPHVYVSMLPFWSEFGPISQQYRRKMKGAVQVHGSAMTRRQLALVATWSFSNSIRSVCYSQDNTLIACAIGSSVHILDGATGRVLFGPLDHDEEVNSVAFSPDGTLVASGSDDKTVKVWKANNGEPFMEPLTGHTDLVLSVAFLPDGKRVASGSRDGTIRVWSLESGLTVLGPLGDPGDRVWSICISSDGIRIASGHGDGTIHAWDARNGQAILEPLLRHNNRVNCISFSPDGTRLAAGSEEHVIRVWNNLTGQVNVDVLEGHTHWVESVAFSPDGKYIVSGSADETVRLWNVEGAPQLVRVLTGHTNVVWSVRFSSDGARIASSSGDRTIRVWDTRTQAPPDSPLQGHTQPVTSVAFSHDAARILSGSNDGTIYIWDAHTGQIAVGPMKGHTQWVISVCFSPDQSRIASGSKDKSVRLWDAYSGQAVGEPLTGHSGRVFSVSFSPDGRLVASGSEDKTIRLWDAQSGDSVGSPLTAHGNGVCSVCFSPGSLRIASGSADNTIIVWDVNIRQPALPPLEGHTDQVWAVCVSPDGERIASGSDDKTARLWDARSGQGLFDPLCGHTDRVRSVCFSPDSSYVVSGSWDKTIRLWAARSGQAVGGPFIGHTDRVTSVAFSPNAGQIVSGSWDPSIRVWDIADLVQVKQSQGDSGDATKPAHSHQSWVLQDDGWVVGSESRLLAWVPPDLHASLMGPRNPLLISTQGAVQLDLESAKLGESWTECYAP